MLWEYDQMVAAQDGRCAICLVPSASLVVDHDHATGVVRELLCNACNIKLGVVEDKVYRKAAVAYLEKHWPRIAKQHPGTATVTWQSSPLCGEENNENQ